MRAVNVYRNGILAGTLTEESREKYLFTYDDNYFFNSDNPSISLTLPKIQKSYTSPFLFPFFYNMLSEGANRKLQSRLLRIDEKDHFSFLIKTAQHDTIGAISIQEIK